MFLGRPLPQLTELPSCAVCLERMDESVKSVLTVICIKSGEGLFWIIFFNFYTSIKGVLVAGIDYS